MTQRIAVLGATGTVGRRVAESLRRRDVEVVPVSRADGVDVLDRGALAAALVAVDAVVDCLDRKTPAAGAAGDFFARAAATVLGALDDADAAGARVVCLSIVNADAPSVNRWMPYYRAKVRQEQSWRVHGRGVCVVRTTQWFEFAEQMMQMLACRGTAVVPGARARPTAAADVAEVLADQALSADPPRLLEVCGPEELDIAELARRVVARRRGDGPGGVRRVVRLPLGCTPLGDGSLLPLDPDIITDTTAEEWLASDRAASGGREPGPVPRSSGEAR